VTGRAEEADRIARQNHFVIITGTLVTFVALWQASVMILRDFAARRRAEEALANEHNLFSSIIDTLPDHIFVKDVKSRYILDNAAHRRYLGVAADRLIEGTTAADYFPAAAVDKFHEDDQKILETGQPVFNREVPVAREGTVEKWLETTKVPLRDPDGAIVGLVGVSSDITERKLAEEKLQRFAEQLKRSNEELQNFANVASHDLQEPLRKIQAFGDRLRVKCAAQLGDTGLDYLSRMENAAQRMQGLIQDLLKLSRIVTQAQPFEKCDLGAILRDVISDLVVVIEKKGADIRVGPLPTVEGDPVQLWQLFQNVVHNAMKFQRPGVRPEIRITGRVFDAPANLIPGADAGEPVVEIAVQDNGIGFEEKFAEQIFVVFQRLHSRDEYEGTGIGLAVCRKITDRHAGRIVAKSSPEGGATFLVTLPVQQHSHKKT
jgi:PAS domain S-box-containing protein